MDESDGYWGAKVVTAFTDELIGKLAESGEYSRPEVTAYVAAVLRQRRDAVGRYWLNRVTPLEDITLTGPLVQFRDLAVEHGFADGPSREYRFHVENANRKRLTEIRSAHVVDIPSLTQLASQTPAQAADRFGRMPLLRLVIQSKKNEKEWSLPVEVILGRTQASNDLKVLGWTHAAKF
jgi:hypothetical protein